MEREQLVTAGFGNQWRRNLRQCLCATGVGQQPVRGRLFHHGGRQRGQLHCETERVYLDGARFGREQLCVGAGNIGQWMDWRFWTVSCMWAASSLRRAAKLRLTWLVPTWMCPPFPSFAPV